DSTFDGNNAYIFATAIETANTVTIVNSSFTNNNTNASAASVIYIGNGVTTILGSTFTGNHGGNFGTIWFSGGSMSIMNSTFSGQTNPSACIAAGGVVAVSNSTFDGNA